MNNSFNNKPHLKLLGVVCFLFCSVLTYGGDNEDTQVYFSAKTIDGEITKLEKVIYWPYTAAWNMPDTSICPGTCVTLAAIANAGHDPPYTFIYTGAGTPAPSTPAGSQGSWTDVSFTVCPAVTTTYTVSIDDAYGDTPATASVTITILPAGDPLCGGVPCNISALGANTSACAPATNTYDVSGSITFVSPPAGGTLTVTDCHGNNQIFNPPFVSPINYNIIGLTADGLACNVVAVFSADPACTFTTNYNAPASCVPAVCTITNLTANPTACSIANNTYDLSGSISFNDPPVAGTLTVTDCNGNNQIFNAPFVSPLNYNITGLTADGLGCNVTAVFSADAACTLTTNYNSPPACNACTTDAGLDDNSCTLSYNLNGTPTSGTGTWTGPAGAIYTPNANDPNATVTVLVPGVYTFNWSIVDAAACTANDDVDISFSFMSIPNTITNPTCNGGSNGQVILAPQGGGVPYSYQWNAAAGNQTSNPGINLSAGNCMVTVTDVYGCSLDSTFTLTEPAAFTYTTASQNANCGLPNGWATVIGFSGGTPGYTYNWGAGPTPNDTAFNLMPGNHIVSVIDGIGCSATFGITVADNPSPVANFTMTPNPTTIFNPLVNFFDQSMAYSPPITSWNWNFGGLDTNILQNPTYTFPEDTGSYPITLTVVDANGCIDTVVQTLIVKSEYAIYIPNAFTPDDDALNDGFFPTGFGISENDYTFMIFDRWGEQIFESNKRFTPWNGTYKGKPVKNGIYVWKLVFTDYNGIDHTEVGHVNVVR